jgi:ABC-type dipeptide/oligopeptide/nickel transport system permease component
MNSNKKNKLKYLVYLIVRFILLFGICSVFLSLMLKHFARFSGTPEEMQTLTAIFNGQLFLNLNYEAINWGKHLIEFCITGLIVLIAIIWSSIISLLMGYHLAKKPHGKSLDFASFLLSLCSSLPIFVIGSLVYFILNDPTSLIDTNLMGLRIVLAGIILGTCEGALSDWPKYFKNIFKDLQNKTYYMAYLSRAGNTTKLAIRYIKPYFLDSLATRISYFFGAVLILEYVIKIPALGYSFLENLRYPGNNYAYCNAMATGLLILLVPIIIRATLSIHSQVRHKVNITV